MEGSLESVAKPEAHKLEKVHTEQECRTVRRQHQLQIREEFAESLGLHEMKLPDGETVHVRMTFAQFAHS